MIHRASRFIKKVAFVCSLSIAHQLAQRAPDISAQNINVNNSNEPEPAIWEERRKRRVRLKDLLLMLFVWQAKTLASAFAEEGGLFSRVKCWSAAATLAGSWNCSGGSKGRYFLSASAGSINWRPGRKLG